MYETEARRLAQQIGAQAVLFLGIGNAASCYRVGSLAFRQVRTAHTHTHRHTHTCIFHGHFAKFVDTVAETAKPATQNEW